MSRPLRISRRSRRSTPLAAAGPAGPERPLSVSELSHRVTRLLEEGIGRVTVEGEISNLRKPRSGHAYFVLKDAGAAINCVCFRSALARLRAPLADGRQIEVDGRLTAYTPRSEYQIIVEAAREAGLGELMRRFLELRDKLKAEGLFDTQRKRPLPRLPRTIGLVTSATGAALRDMLNVLWRRGAGLEVVLSPCAVQGDAAPGEIVRAIGRLRRHARCEVIIVGRGGGSIEDLWAFNDESVVRAIAACEIPIVSAVGHETDTTLSDFAADLRAPTPSAAAELVTAGYDDFIASLGRIHQSLEREVRRRIQSRRAALHASLSSWGMRRPIERIGFALQRIDDYGQRIERAAQGRLQLLRQRLKQGTGRLEGLHPDRRIRLAAGDLGRLRLHLSALSPSRRWGQRIKGGRDTARHLDLRLRRSMQSRLSEAGLRLGALGGRLETLGPSAVLERGFSIITTMKGHKIIKSPDQVKLGQKLRVQSAGGEWRATPLPNEDELFDGQ